MLEQVVGRSLPGLWPLPLAPLPALWAGDCPASPAPTPESTQALRHFLEEAAYVASKGHFIQAWPSAWASSAMSRARQAAQGHRKTAVVG